MIRLGTLSNAINQNCIGVKMKFVLSGTIIVRFLVLVTTMVTKVDHSNHRSNDRSNHRGYYDGYYDRY